MVLNHRYRSVANCSLWPLGYGASFSFYLRARLFHMKHEKQRSVTPDEDIAVTLEEEVKFVEQLYAEQMGAQARTAGPELTVSQKRARLLERVPVEEKIVPATGHQPRDRSEVEVARSGHAGRGTSRAAGCRGLGDRRGVHTHAPCARGTLTRACARTTHPRVLQEREFDLKSLMHPSHEIQRVSGDPDLYAQKRRRPIRPFQWPLVTVIGAISKLESSTLLNSLRTAQYRSPWGGWI